MLFEWQGILRFISESSFSLDRVFFPSLFYNDGCSKNLCRHKPGTKPQIDSLDKTSASFNLKSSIFKHFLLFYTYLQKYYKTFKHHFFCLKPIAHKCYISSISSKHLFIAVSDLGSRKKIII